MMQAAADDDHADLDELHIADDGADAKRGDAEANAKRGDAEANGLGGDAGSAGDRRAKSDAARSATAPVGDKAAGKAGGGSAQGKEGGLFKTQEVQTAGHSSGAFKKYLAAAGGVPAAAVYLTLMASTYSCVGLTDIWLAHWVSTENTLPVNTCILGWVFSWAAAGGGGAPCTLSARIALDRPCSRPSSQVRAAFRWANCAHESLRHAGSLDGRERQPQSTPPDADPAAARAIVVV